MITIVTIQQRVAASFGLPLLEMSSARRGGGVARARQVAMYLARELTPASFPQIGRAFDRDHTTSLHACTRIADLMAADPTFRDQVNVIREQLEAVPDEW